VLLPERNRKDLDEIPPEVTGAMHFIYKSSLAEALLALFPADSFKKKS
jgi:ATP-dependent Lon protease